MDFSRPDLPAAPTLPNYGGADIRILDSEPPVRFAARELSAYLPRLRPGAQAEIFLGPPGLALSAAGFPERQLRTEGSILIHGDGRRYVLAGGSPAAILHAAYAFLEILGARWLRPGPSGEIIRPVDGPLPTLSMVSAPAFESRGITEGCLSWWPANAPFDEWLAETLELVDWMGKMRLNRLFVHFNRLPPGDLSPLVPELEKRGIALELGGHALPKLLPMELRERDPELCRISGGLRRLDANFCTSNPRTLAIISDGARRYVEALPPAEVYHFWSYDAKEDPWCSCPRCASMSQVEQMWRSVAAVAEAVASVRPSARVSGLLYHESIEAAASAPEWALTTFAPRERCYLHPIDGACARNERYASQLRADLELQGEKLSVLEYYGDPILFGRPASRPRLVSSDLQAYHSFGVRSVSSLVFGALSGWLYPLQLYAYARAAWDPEGAANVSADYALAVAPSQADVLVSYFDVLEAAAGTHLRFCGYGEDGSWATLPFPPPQPAVEILRHVEDLRRGSVLLEEAGALLAGLPQESKLVADARSSHRLEEAFHRAVLGETMALAGQGRDGFSRGFSEAAAVLASVSADTRGVFGTHWMMPWLQRCGSAGRAVPV